MNHEVLPLSVVVLSEVSGWIRRPSHRGILAAVPWPYIVA